MLCETVGPAPSRVVLTVRRATVERIPCQNPWKRPSPRARTAEPPQASGRRLLAVTYGLAWSRGGGRGGGIDGQRSHQHSLHRGKETQAHGAKLRLSQGRAKTHPPGSLYGLVYHDTMILEYHGTEARVARVFLGVWGRSCSSIIDNSLNDLFGLLSHIDRLSFCRTRAATKSVNGLFRLFAEPATYLPYGTATAAMHAGS
jgi:hypothetical protein